MEQRSVKRTKFANAADVSATAVSHGAQGEHERRWRRRRVALTHLAADLIIFILKTGGWEKGGDTVG